MPAEAGRRCGGLAAAFVFRKILELVDSHFAVCEDGPDLQFPAKGFDVGGESADVYVSAVLDFGDFSPVLAVEISSPKQDFSDLIEKCESLLAAGAPVCWIVDPEKRQAWIFSHLGLTDAQNTLDVDLSSSSLSLPLAEMWAKLDHTEVELRLHRHRHPFQFFHQPVGQAFIQLIARPGYIENGDRFVRFGIHQHQFYVAAPGRYGRRQVVQQPLADLRRQNQLACIHPKLRC